MTNMADYETLLYDERDAVAYITLNRPESLNAFDSVMMRELKSVWQALRLNDDVRCIVLTGSGERAFCVGIDRNADDYEEVRPPTLVSWPVGTSVTGRSEARTFSARKSTACSVTGASCAGGR